MWKYQILLFLILIGMISCDSEYSYGVRIVNNSGEPLKIDFKSDTHRDGPIQEYIFIDNEQSELIISTKDLSKDIENVCDSVALYVRASTITSGKRSNLEWCDPSIKLELVDIGQYEYLVEYKEEHFK